MAPASTGTSSVMLTVAEELLLVRPAVRPLRSRFSRVRSAKFLALGVTGGLSPGLTR
jgi:hypothetical protein